MLHNLVFYSLETHGTLNVIIINAKSQVVNSIFSVQIVLLGSREHEKVQLNSKLRFKILSN